MYVFFFTQKTAYVLRISDWSSDVCSSDLLDVFNGFLLSANLDALFDRFLISFDNQGALVIAPTLAEMDLLPLGIRPGMKLRWINALHQPYLALHRVR